MYSAVSCSFMQGTRIIRDTFDKTTVRTSLIAISLIHSKIDNCNSLPLNLPTRTRRRDADDHRFQLVVVDVASAGGRTFRTPVGASWCQLSVGSSELVADRCLASASLRVSWWTQYSATAVGKTLSWCVN